MDVAPPLGELRAAFAGIGPSMPGAPAIEVKHLTKSYGDVAAVDGLDLEIQVGEIFAMLGPNGAGKTTTVEILEGYRHRDGGEVRVLGYDPGRERKLLKPLIGIVLQSTGVDRYLTVSETIEMYASYYPHPRPTGEIVELVGLDAKRTRACSSSRAASSAVSTSPLPSRVTPTCSSSTSRRPASTPRRAGKRGRS